MTSNPIDPAMDRMSVAPGPDGDQSANKPAPVGSADAGTDASIAERLARNPESKDARLDRALDESMDASDPPASTQPVHNHSLPESSGYDPKKEAKLAGGQSGQGGQGVVGRILSKMGLG